MDGVMRNTMHDVAYIMRSRRTFGLAQPIGILVAGGIGFGSGFSEHGVEGWGNDRQQTPVCLVAPEYIRGVPDEPCWCCDVDMSGWIYVY
jgi:hypothetical protein